MTNTVDRLNLVELQVLYENKYNKRNRRKILKQIFEPILKIPYEKDNILNQYESDLELHQDKFDIFLDILVILADRPKITLTSLVEIFGEVHSKTPDEMKDQLDTILQGDKLGYYRVLENNRGDNIDIHSLWNLPETIRQELDKFKYLNPMLVEPIQTNLKEDNKGSGYLTIGSDSLLLGHRLNHHEQDICTEYLDNINKTKFTLNIDTIKAYRNSWENLDAPKQGESEQDYERRLVSFQMYQDNAYKTYLEIIKAGNQFHFTHKYDKRGRVYNQGYYISYQGNSYAKAIIELANKESISEEINFF